MKKNMKIDIKKRLFYFTKGMYLLLVITITSLITYCICHNELINTYDKFMLYSIVLLMTGALLFISFIVLIFIDVENYLFKDKDKYKEIDSLEDYLSQHKERKINE